MKTLFWLFRTYDEARSAVDTLLDLEIEPDDVNAVIAEEEAKEAMDVNWGTAPVQVSDEENAPHAQQTESLRGLDKLLAGEQAVALGDVGPVLAGGELVTLAVNAAASPASQEQAGLFGALLDLGVPEDAARESADGVKAGGVLVAVRVPDERASEVRGAVSNVGAQIRASAVVG